MDISILDFGLGTALFSCALATQGIRGEEIPIDSATLRCLVDDKYAAKIKTSMRELLAPRSDLAESIEQRFARLSAKWKKETRLLSNEARMAENQAYRQIIAMGEQVIPFILADLEKTNDHWFTALREITGENPVPRKDGGTKIKIRVAAWIAWGKAHGYRW